MNRFKASNLTYKVLEGDSKLDGGLKIAKELLKKEKELHSAIIFSNDLMAIGAIKFFQKSGIRVPQDNALFRISQSSSFKARIRGSTAGSPSSTNSSHCFFAIK